ncbi:MAG: diadenylate cyclase CdaA [Bacteroidaceae bacterium]|nr:diadenylate cyclase CdaA [Bacteroidaceae bacterium]
MITIGIKDIIDIILVALLLFYIYKLMKRSYAANIFTGVIIFIIAWIVVSQVFNMRLLGTIFDKVVSIGLIALVVVFQEEIRRFFSTIGTRRSSIFRLFGKKHRQQMSHQDIMPIVLACKKMSDDKVGALIVMERAVGLGEYISSGEEIDAKVNNSLIQNIFFKNSPLHDGAMIIRDGRIVAAGCILPVSHDSDIPKSLGLRHRAALGIVEKSDALAIIVSEETGNISIAHNGKFQLKVTPDEMETMLTQD